MSAFARPASATQDDNASSTVLAGKPTSTAAGAGKPSLLQGSKRRAPLGDVSNINAARSAQQQQAAGKACEKQAFGLVPRTRSQTAAAARQIQEKGMSMSSLLQSRSETAVAAAPKAASPAPPSPLPDIDGADKMNPLAATEYVNDIYSYYKRVEHKFRVAPDYMNAQTDINVKMRAILIDWLVEVHLKFKLMPETLFLTVNLIDRFLALKPVTRRNLQLVGVTGMLIASKYEEIWAPEIRDFVYISDKAYTREQIISMEKLMLNTLGFKLTLPTPYNFLARFLKAAGAHLDKQVTMLSSFLIELAQVDAGMLKYSYSLQSASALYVAMRTFGKTNPYPHALAKHSGFPMEDVRPCAEEIVNLHKNAPTGSLNAVYKKYSHAKFLEIAKTAPCTAILEEVSEELL